MFTIIHTKLNCDVHQEECRRLRSAYDALAHRYRGVRVVDNPEELRSALRDLDSTQEMLRAEAKAAPPEWALGRAESQDRAVAAPRTEQAGNVAT
ncbi:hypothetical protein [Nocardia sp. IFM 10818]